MKWMSCLLLGFIFLAGCSKKPTVPDVVQNMMDTEIPADRQIHIQNLGKVLIRQQTPTCYFSGGLLIDQVRFFIALGQGYSLNGAARLQPYDIEGRCSVQSDTVFFQGVEFPNRQGVPYRLVLAVWQGDPAHGGGAWVGSIERADGVRDDRRGWRPFRDGITLKPSWMIRRENRAYAIGESITADLEDLGKAFARDARKVLDSQ